MTGERVSSWPWLGLVFPGPNLFVNYRIDALHYEGVNPADISDSGELQGANPAGPPGSPLLDAGLNRVEQVGFTQPGLYLVICNVTPHLRDAMYAWVRVVANDDWRDGDGRDDDEHREHR